MLARLRGLVPRPRLRHGLRASEQDVQAHYDLSNEFFALWLDPSLTYSCAVFEEPDQSLEEAQQHKYRLLCDRLGLASHHHLLEIGTGWGGMALHAARERGCRVTTTTISTRTVRSRVAARRRGGSIGSRRRARARLPHAHRDATTASCRSRCSRPSATTSCPTYFRALDRLLAPNGVVAIQTITIPEQRYRSYRRSEDWLRRHIFPGGLLPSVGEITRVVRSCDPPRRVRARRDRPALRADARPLARAIPRARRTRCARSASTSASAAPGSSISPTARRPSRAARSATCRWRSRGRSSATRPLPLK